MRKGCWRGCGYHAAVIASQSPMKPVTGSTYASSSGIYTYGPVLCFQMTITSAPYAPREIKRYDAAFISELCVKMRVNEDELRGNRLHFKGGVWCVRTLSPGRSREAGGVSLRKCLYNKSCDALVEWKCAAVNSLGRRSWERAKIRFLPSENCRACGLDLFLSRSRSTYTVYFGVWHMH